MKRAKRKPDTWLSFSRTGCDPGTAAIVGAVPPCGKAAMPNGPTLQSCSAGVSSNQAWTTNRSAIRHASFRFEKVEIWPQTITWRRLG
jgi:hypothetical protein